MTDEINFYQFLLAQKPICTQSPLKLELGAELHSELRAKCKFELGMDLLADRCYNTLLCNVSNNGCIGRPFPRYEQVYNALQKLNVVIVESTYRGVDVYLAKALTDCGKCPFNSVCESTCTTQNSYMRRNEHPENNPPESMLVPYEDFERGKYKALTPEDVEHCGPGDWEYEELPLDCLSNRQREVIEMVMYERLDQMEIASKLGIGQDVVSRHKSAALARLEEFGKARKAIREKGAPKRVREYYIENKTQKKISSEMGISQPAVMQFIARWYNSNCV